MILALLLIWGIFTVTTSGTFLTPRNLSNLTRQMCITGILAIGMVLVIVSGNIDLSVGSAVGFTGGMAAIANLWWGWPLLLALGGAMLLGLLLGYVQGWLTAYKRIPAFIVTLSGLMAFRGAIKGATGGETVGPLPDAFKFIGQGYLTKLLGWFLAVSAIVVFIFVLYRGYRRRQEYGLEGPSVVGVVARAVLGGVVALGFVGVLNSYEGIPLPVILLLALALCMDFVARQTTFGRRVYAIGGNAEAALLSGINLKTHVAAVFAMMGALSAASGIVYTARVGSATADAGKILELDAIAACVIGGTSLMGGRGSVGGAIVGALVMASLDNGMSLMNLEDFFQDIIKGLILVIAVWIDIASKRS
jgi:D-xylose transport system permease protein